MTSWLIDLFIKKNPSRSATILPVSLLQSMTGYQGETERNETHDIHIMPRPSASHCA